MYSYVPRFANGYFSRSSRGWAKLCTCLMGNIPGGHLQILDVIPLCTYFKKATCNILLQLSKLSLSCNTTHKKDVDRTTYGVIA